MAFAAFCDCGKRMLERRTDGGRDRYFLHPSNGKTYCPDCWCKNVPLRDRVLIKLYGFAIWVELRTAGIQRRLIALLT